MRQMKSLIAFNSSKLKFGTIISLYLAIMISSINMIFQLSCGDTSLYGVLSRLMSERLSVPLSRSKVLIFLPVVERQSCSTLFKTCRKTNFSLRFTLSIKDINDFVMCLVLERGSMKKRCVSLGRSSITLCETFQEFSNFLKHFDVESQRGEL